ncbi:MAG: hypothetical protein ISQ41_02380 [Flavobacteriaceae bacterium]|nr:hypothetical protein [Flavobacteriaceae bacterium]
MKNIFKLSLITLILTSCEINTGDSTATESNQNNSMVSFENGDIMTSATEDPLGTKFSYPTG